MSRTILSVPVTDELKRSLMTRAEQLDRPLSWVVREALRAWLASGAGERQVEYRGGEGRVERDIPDTSADVGLGPPPAASGTKAERLASARAAVARHQARAGHGDELEVSSEDGKRPMQVPGRRGFETRVTPNGLRLDVPIPGESYVDEND